MKRSITYNITIIAATAFPFGTSSANLLRNLSLGLSYHEVNVHLLITRGVNQEIYRSEPRTNSISGIKYTYCSFKKKPNSFLLKLLDVFIGIVVVQLIIIKKKIHNEIDSVITYTGFAYQNLPVVLLSKMLKIRVYKYSVDWYNKESIVSKGWMLPKWWFFNLEISVFDKYLTGIIVISKTLYNHYIKIGVSKKSILIIPNFIDISSFENDEQSTNKLTVGYCGAALLLNGVDDLIRAVSLLDNKDMYLSIIGDVVGGESQIPPLIKLSSELGISDQINFKGRVSSEKIPGLLKECDILVLPRKNTQYAQAGFPTKLGEYFATKRPVIMTKVGDISLLFKSNHHLVLAEPDSPKSLASALESLIKNEKLRIEIGLNGHSWAQENLDYRKNGMKLKKFIASISN